MIHQAALSAANLCEYSFLKHMLRYRVIIHGRNFRLKLDGKWEKFGFYTPRFANAADPVLAEHVALEDFRQTDKYFELMEQSLNSVEDEPVLCGEDIVQVPPDQGFEKGPPGLAFYRESNE